MQKIGNAIQLSASDLVAHLNCRNLTELDLAVAKGTLAKPRTWNPLLDVLRERGLRHEQGYVDHLSAKGLDIETVAGVGLDEDAVAATAKAMCLGREVIVQGAFLADSWGGRTDVRRFGGQALYRGRAFCPALFRSKLKLSCHLLQAALRLEDGRRARATSAPPLLPPLLRRHPSTPLRSSPRWRRRPTTRPLRQS